MKGISKGSVIVDRDDDVSGIVKGDVTIRSGVRATVSGIVKGDVVIEEGAMVDVDGIVSGRVIGMPASVTGIVSGR